MKLYHCDRVVKIEASDDFRDAKQKADSRKRSARKAVQTKLKMLQEYLDNLTIEVPVMELEVLIEAARRNFYSLRYSSDVTLSNERMCVNFLRHCGTKYERELRKLAGKTGKGDAYYEIKEKVLDEIAFTYEWLAEECHRQQQEMDRKRRESY